MFFQAGKNKTVAVKRKLPEMTYIHTTNKNDEKDYLQKKEAENIEGKKKRLLNKQKSGHRRSRFLTGWH